MIAATVWQVKLSIGIETTFIGYKMATGAVMIPGTEGQSNWCRFGSGWTMDIWDIQILL